MRYIVMDLEWNSALSRSKVVREPFKLAGEVIQIGAVMVDDYRTMNVIGEFNELIKPVHYTKMKKEVTELTDITDEDIATGRPFKDVCEEFLEWCGDDYAFITWSGNDIYMLEDNMLLHQMDSKRLPACYDAQVIFDDLVTHEDRSFALNYAMWKLNIKPKQCHNALNDAINTVEVMKRLDITSEDMYYSEVGVWAS